MKELVIYVGHHQPVGERWVEESLVDALLESGQCVLPRHNVKKKSIGKKEEILKPNNEWKEKTIKAWIEQQNIPIKYNINNNTKKEILEKLKELGCI